MSTVFRVPEERISDGLAMTDLPSWDSLSHMNLILEIERQYDVQLSGDEIADMQSVPRILEILSRHSLNQDC